MPRLKTLLADQVAVWSPPLPSAIVSWESIGGGRNTKVYLITCEDSSRYVAKFYAGGAAGGQDRLRAEFQGSKFMWENGVDCIPMPVAKTEDNQSAVYEFIPGAAISSSEASPSDIEQAVRFLVILKDLGSKDGSRQLPDASDACFSVADNVESIMRRLTLLSGVTREGRQHRDLDAYLKDEFLPALELVKEHTEGALEKLGVSFSKQLDAAERTLSPSDFGFHNALRQRDGRIVFLDFEYFGWDDPAKMICDFLLHPGMDLDESLKKQFLALILEGFHDQPLLAKRVKLLYPFCGLKWCLILLNEFLPEYSQRRIFVQDSLEDESQVLALQLSKAQDLLRTILRRDEYSPTAD